MDLSKMGALGSIAGGIFAALTFAALIWPFPQIKSRRPSSLAIPQKKPAIRLISVLLMISFLLSAAAIYGAWHPSDSLEVLPIDKLELVNEKTFVNEQIEVDGKFFQHCHFSSVRFMVRGQHN